MDTTPPQVAEKPPQVIDITPVTDLWLQEQARYINTRVKATDEKLKAAYKDMIEISRKLVEVKDALKNEGRYIQWCNSSLTITYRQACQCEAVARTMGDLKRDDLFSIGALQTLASSTVPESARIEARARAESGEYISPDLALVIAKAPDYVKQAVDEKDLTEKTAAAAVRSYQKSFPDVQTAVMEWQLTNSDVIDWLNHVYQLHCQSADKAETTWTELQHNAGVMVYDDDQKPLTTANKTDCDLYLQYRSWGHRQQAAAAKTYVLQAEPMFIANGQVIVKTNLPDGHLVKVTIWHEE